jgi:hypothetical protein
VHLLRAIGDALHRKAKLAQVITRDMENDIAVVEVGGVLTAVT